MKTLLKLWKHKFTSICVHDFRIICWQKRLTINCSMSMDHDYLSICTTQRYDHNIPLINYTPQSHTIFKKLAGFIKRNQFDVRSLSFATYKRKFNHCFTSPFLFSFFVIYFRCWMILISFQISDMPLNFLFFSLFSQWHGDSTSAFETEAPRC